jgi:hypothetical protein
MDDVILANFARVDKVVSRSGELMVSPGAYSRKAVIMAFELNGGVEAFADWASKNPSEFYTKLFGKVIGKEVTVKNEDNIEDLLGVLDLEAAEVTDLDVVEMVDEGPSEPSQALRESVLKDKLASAAKRFARGEYED